MYRKLAGILLGGSLVAILYQPVTGIILLSLFTILTVSTAAFKVYQNRRRPIPKIIIKPPEPQQESAVERELNFIAGRYKERALNNGFESIEDIPSELKV